MAEGTPFRAVAIHCIDGRFVDAHAKAIRMLREQFHGELVDQIANPGVSASLIVPDETTPAIFANVRGAILLHKIKAIAILEHEDCGMYRLLAEKGDRRFAVTPETEREVHAVNARAAADALKAQFPDKAFLFRYVRLDGTVEDLSGASA